MREPTSDHPSLEPPLIKISIGGLLDGAGFGDGQWGRTICLRSTDMKMMEA